MFEYFNQFFIFLIYMLFDFIKPINYIINKRFKCILINHCFISILYIKKIAYFGFLGRLFPFQNYPRLSI